MTGFSEEKSAAGKAARSKWTRPAVRRLMAGAAETGGAANQDIGVSQS